MNPAATVPPVAAGIARPAPAVGTQAARGAFWTILFSVLNKCVTLGSQIALAWFLVPEDMGVVALTLSITSVVSTFCAFNLAKVLIQRRDSFQQDAGQVFWLALAMNVTASLLLVALSPIGASLFKEPRVTSLTLVVAAAIPFMALPTIYVAALYRDLRFKSIAMIQFGEGALRSGAAVALAALGSGALSLVLPLVPGAIYSTVAFRWAAGRLPLSRPAPRTWPALLAPALWLMLQTLFVAVQAHGTNFVIGITHNSTVAGFYFWGFSISSQAMFLLAANLQGVLFPVLSKVNDDPLRQYLGFRKACQVLTVIAVPVCVLQMVLARPLIELAFADRWARSIPVVEWLSLGFLTQSLTVLASSLLLARGRFGLLAALTGLSAVMVTAAATIGALTGAEAEIARWVGGSLFLTGLAAGIVALRQFNRNALALAGLAGVPLLLVPASILAGWLARMATQSYGPMIVIPATTFAVLGVHLLLVRTMLPEIAKEILARLKMGRWTDAAASAPRLDPV